MSYLDFIPVDFSTCDRGMGRLIFEFEESKIERKVKVVGEEFENLFPKPFLAIR